jgi:hypothetical protein
MDLCFPPPDADLLLDPDGASQCSLKEEEGSKERWRHVWKRHVVARVHAVGGGRTQTKQRIRT